MTESRYTCECGTVYIGQSGRSIDLRIKEHERHIRLAQPEKSAVAEHSLDHDHMTPNYSPQKQVTQIATSGRPLK